MDREQARQEIRAHWRDFGPADKSGKGIICPICDNGRGRDGDGIRENPKKPGQLKCFKCGWTGDAIDLYKIVWNIDDYNEALQCAAEYLGISIDPYRPSAAEDFQTADNDDRAGAAQRHAGGIDRETPTGQKKSPQAGAGTATTAQIADYTGYYRECAQRLRDPAAISYLQARGISQETARAFNLGYDSEWISPTVIKAQEAKGNSWRPPATARLIMPVSRNYYVARAINPEIKDYPKMNETGGGGIDIFNLQAIQGAQTVFIVEGIIDALSIIECGASAIALNSTSNAERLIKEIERQKTACSFVICPDNDAPGQRAAETIEKGLQRLNIKHITANICGEYKDPNDALTGNRQELKQAIMEAQAKAATADYLTAFFEKISGEAYRPYTTDIPFFDNLLSGGPIRQTVLLLLAAPAAGKTTLCQQIAESMARHGKPVLYLNLEMSREQMIAKSISARCTFKGQTMTALDVMQGYKWTDPQRQAVTNAISEYRESIYPYLNYNPDGITGELETIREYLHRIGEAARAAGSPAPVVVLDYLHLISCRGQDVQETIKQSMAMLKQYAMQNDSFCIAISATNRESNKAGRITMESGRDSSGIEYGGDYVLSLNYYQIETGSVKPTDINKVSILQGRAWRQMIIRVLKGRLCIPGRAARVYFHAAGNRFYAEDEFLPDNEDIIEFNAADPELNALDNVDVIRIQGAGKEKQKISAKF